MEYQFRPISEWPGQRTKYPRDARFKASYEQTLKLLEYELEWLNAKNAVIQLDADSGSFRLDGMLRATAVTKSPAVIVSFESKHGHLSYPCDTFSDWKSNLRAIALGLGSLRTVDRYGISRRGEQYRGWDALPAPAPSLIDPFQILARLSCRTLQEVKARPRVALMAALHNTHPDKGGDREEWIRLMRAKEELTARGDL